MGLSQPTLGRQIAALEESLQVVLYEKSGRGLVLTPTGKDLLVHAHQMAEAAVDLSLAASGNSSSLKGKVCISASEIAAAYVLPKLADIAIRAYRPTQLDLIGKKLGIQRWGLYVSKDYLATQGSLESKAELEKASFIGIGQTDTIITHLETQELHISQSNIAVITQNMSVAMELIKNGFGIGVLPVNIGKTQPELCRVASKIVQFEVENWLVTHSELRSNRRIRVVYDFLSTELSN